MNHNIKGTGLDITPELRAYVEKKLEQPSKLLQRDPSAHVDVELEFAHGERDKKYRAEFTLAGHAALYRADARGYTMHEAIDLAVDALVRELTRAKKKRLARLRHGAGRIKDFIRGFRDSF